MRYEASQGNYVISLCRKNLPCLSFLSAAAAVMIYCDSLPDGAHRLSCMLTQLPVFRPNTAAYSFGITQLRRKYYVAFATAFISTQCVQSGTGTSRAGLPI